MSTNNYTGPDRDALDKYIDPGDRLLLAALREGTFILAVRCQVCGAPLTAKQSKARGLGPACASKVKGAA